MADLCRGFPANACELSCNHSENLTMESGVCVLCGGTYEEGRSHNPWPLRAGECCGTCNELVLVVRAAIKEHDERHGTNVAAHLAEEE